MNPLVFHGKTLERGDEITVMFDITRIGACWIGWAIDGFVLPPWKGPLNVWRNGWTGHGMSYSCSYAHVFYILRRIFLDVRLDYVDIYSPRFAVARGF